MSEDENSSKLGATGTAIRAGVSSTRVSSSASSLQEAPKLEDQELIRQSMAGNRDAYRELFDRYQSRIFSMALDLLRSREDAQDVTQDAFVKAYLSLADFKGDSAFFTWLYRIAFNLAIDLKRKVKRRGGPAAEFEEGVAYEVEGLGEHIQNPHAALYRKQQQLHLRKALDTLSDEHRAVVVLREVDGLSYDEIAQATGVSVGTVMSRLFYARKKLQKALREVAPEHSSSTQGPESRRDDGDDQNPSPPPLGTSGSASPDTLAGRRSLRVGAPRRSIVQQLEHSLSALFRLLNDCVAHFPLPAAKPGSRRIKLNILRELFVSREPQIDKMSVIANG